MQIAGHGSEDQVLCRNLFASFTSNLSNNVLVSMAHCWRSLTLVSNVWEVAPRSLFCAQNRLNVLWEVRFEYISFQAIIIVHTQILVHRWDPVQLFLWCFTDGLH